MESVLLILKEVLKIFLSSFVMAVAVKLIGLIWEL